jgi:hypothetical protein
VRRVGLEPTTRGLRVLCYSCQPMQKACSPMSKYAIPSRHTQIPGVGQCCRMMTHVRAVDHAWITHRSHDWWNQCPVGMPRTWVPETTMAVYRRRDRRVAAICVSVPSYAPRCWRRSFDAGRVHCGGPTTGYRCRVACHALRSHTSRSDSGWRLQRRMVRVRFPFRLSGQQLAAASPARFLGQFSMRRHCAMIALA